MAKSQGKTRYINMTQGPELKCIILFALPIMLGQLLQQLYSTVDGIIVGNFVSSVGLAAIGNCGTMTFMFIAISNGMANGSGIIISQAFGAGRKEDMRAAAASILVLMLIIGAAITAFGTLGANFCASKLLAIREEGLKEQAIIYLSIYSAGIIFTFLYNAVAAILRAVGDSKALLYFLLVSTVVNTVLDLLFVVTFQWGIAGAAWATVISQVACFAVSAIYMFKNYPDFRFRSARELLPQRRITMLCLRMGIPSTAQSLIISSGHIFLQRLVNSFGEVITAAVTVGSRFDHYTTIPTMSLNQAVASFSGQNVGAGRYDRVKRGTWHTAFFNCGVVIVLCAILYIFASPLCRLFGVEGETLMQAVAYLHVLALSVPIFAFYMPFNATMQGAGAPLSSALVSLVGLLIRVVGAYVLVYVFNWGSNACWSTYWLGWGAGMVLSISLYAGGGWKKKRLMHTHAEDLEREKLI